MPDGNANREEILTRRIREGIDALDTRLRRLRRTNASLLITGIVASALSTLVTAVTAAQGPVVGTGTEGWRLACSVGAVFSFGTTVSIGVNQRLKIDERLAETTQCVGRLRALEVAMATGSRAWEDIADEYAEIVAAYPDLIK